MVDNGQGDLLDVIFTREVVLVRGFDHENELNSLSAGSDKSVVEQIYSGEAAKFRSYFLPDGYAFDEFDKFSEFVKGYYEIEFDDEMLKKLYEKGELEKEKLKEIR